MLLLIHHRNRDWSYLCPQCCTERWLVFWITSWASLHTPWTLVQWPPSSGCSRRERRWAEDDFIGSCKQTEHGNLWFYFIFGLNTIPHGSLVLIRLQWSVLKQSVQMFKYWCHGKTTKATDVFAKTVGHTAVWIEGMRVLTVLIALGLVYAFH